MSEPLLILRLIYKEAVAGLGNLATAPQLWREADGKSDFFYAMLDSPEQAT